MEPFPSFFYIGPGPGIGAVGAMLALLGAALLMVVGLVWYPLKCLLERLRSSRNGKGSTRAERGAASPNG